MSPFSHFDMSALGLALAVPAIINGELLTRKPNIHRKLKDKMRISSWLLLQVAIATISYFVLSAIINISESARLTVCAIFIGYAVFTMWQVEKQRKKQPQQLF